MTRILVGGVPGVGKSTVARIAAERLGWSTASFGSIMFDRAQASGMAPHRDALRSLPWSALASFELDAARTIGAMERVFVDTQFVVRGSTGFRHFSELYARETRANGIVVIAAPPELVAARRVADTSRMRDPQSPKDIATHGSVVIETARDLATALRARFGVIANVTPEASGEALAGFARDLNLALA